MGIARLTESSVARSNSTTLLCTSAPKLAITSPHGLITMECPHVSRPHG
ncbi:Uncharacterised protein [Vibrio cholerae]|nr:Uncharacterised protein [Vibrio cholerae]